MSNDGRRQSLPDSTDPWIPDFSGHTIEESLESWIYCSRVSTRPKFLNVKPINRIAIAGAVRSRTTRRLNLRDEITSNALMKEFAPFFDFSATCTVDFFTQAEGTDVHKARGDYDLGIFANIRDGTQIETQTTHEKSRDRNIGTPTPEEPSNRNDSNAPPEHKFFNTVSEFADTDVAYWNLAQKHHMRFVLGWGGAKFIDGFHFTPVLPSLKYSDKLGCQLVPADLYTQTHIKDCIQRLSISEEAKSKDPILRYIRAYACIRNDVLEKMAASASPESINNPLFSGGLELVEKLRLLQKLRELQGRNNPWVNSREVEGRSLAELQQTVEKPGRMVNMERSIRRWFGRQYKKPHP